MPFIVTSQDDHAEWRPGEPAKPAPGAVRELPDLTPLPRLYGVAKATDVHNLLGEPQAAKLAMFVRELETLQASPLLKTVPETPEQAHQVADIIKSAATASAELERSRKGLVQPMNDKVKAINAVYKQLTEPLEKVRATADRLVIAHNQAERARIQREQEEQRRRMAEAAAREAQAVEAAGLAPDEEAREMAMLQAEQASRELATAQVTVPDEAPRAYRSDTGTLGIRKTYALSGFDPDKVPQRYWRDPAVLEALRKVLAKAVKAGYHEIPGCTIGEVESTNVRA